MAELLSAINFPQSNIAEYSEVLTDLVAGATTVTLVNAQGYSADSYFRIGIGERAEIKKVTSVTGNVITIFGSFGFDHKAGEKVIKLRGNQVRFYAATNVNGTVPADASFSAIATVDIEADQEETEYNHSAGGSGYWYKYTFFHSVQGTETDLDDSFGMRGGNFGEYTTAEAVRMEAGLMGNEYVTNGYITQRIEEAQSEVDSSLSIAGYVLPLVDVPSVIENATKLLAAGYILSADYGPEFEGTVKDGQLKIKMARDILAKIESGAIDLVGIEVDLAVDAGVRGYPDNTADDDLIDEGRIFTIRDKF